MGAVIVALAGALMVFFGPHKLGDELVVVVPSADAHVGMVVVERRGERTILNRAYAASRIVDSSAPRAEILDESVVRQEFSPALTALPSRPKSFLLYFLEATDEFTPESQVELGRVLTELRESNSPDVEVIGHSDRLASDEFNDRLSLQRAQRVREELVRLGIAPARIRTAGRGEREPLVPTADGIAEPGNRRVEINVR